MDRNTLLGMGFGLLSAALFSTLGLWVKLIDADVWTVLFWRAVISAALIGAAAWLRRARPTATLGAPHAAIGTRPPIDRREWLIAVTAALGAITTIGAYHHTHVANVALIYALVPLATALLAWRWLGDRPLRGEWAGASLALLGTAVLLSGSRGQGVWLGDLLALAMVAAMAVWICQYRRWPGVSSTRPTALSSLMLLPLSGWLGDPLGVDARELVLLVGLAASFALAQVALAEASRRLRSTQVALLSMLEAPMAPVWARWVLDERAPWQSWIGGTMVLGAAIAALWSRHRQHTASNPSPPRGPTP